MGSYVLFCYRCGEVIDFPEEWMEKIVCTAVDGKERKLSDNVRVIQKIKTKSKKVGRLRTLFKKALSPFYFLLAIFYLSLNDKS
jgi:hypothetical protein